ncbi:MAG: glycosyltransferase family 1 protein [Cyanobacteria bacterium P01_G01_bin.19]
MHILIPVLHRPSKPTGVCRHAVNLAQCLSDTDKVTKITLIIGEWQQQYFAESFNLLSPKIELLAIKIKNTSLARNKWFLFDLPRIANRLQPDLVHLSFPFPFIRSRFKSPVISTIHDFYPYECPENFGFPQVWFNRWFLRQCLDNSDGLSCVSQATLKSLKQYFPKLDIKKQIRLIYNYVDFRHVTPRIPEKLAKETNLSFILCVAQHRQNKNLDLLIKAYSRLLKWGVIKPTTKLILVGNSGPETEKLETLRHTLDLEKQVLFMSSLSDKELCWLYKNCQLFAIPSSTEGFCIPLVEAITLAPKVICSDIPIFREVGSSNCHYFELNERSLDNLCEAMLSVLKESSSNAHDEELRFSKEYVAQQLLNFYVSIG